MDFIKDFEDRVEETEKYFQFLILVDSLSSFQNLQGSRSHKIIINSKEILPLKNKISKAGVYNLDIELKKTIKATSFLLLYNLIESSIVSALNAYFEAISKHKLKYKDFNSEIKKVWIQYKHKSFKNSQTIDILNAIDEIFEEIVEIAPKSINNNGVTKVVEHYDAFRLDIGKTDISGNLDARKIRELSELYGFKMPLNKECESLLTIKNSRNKLAHGENSFSDVGKQSIEDLFIMKQETIKFIRSVLKAINSSIEKSVYKAK